ncbi:hypothetical protein DFJ74DRAFT_20794 [Hyaloraphidium curvatum]|nr:hypothetical protein DFJ74DRAFT_20794 [Hyaloraphidium curvatum]
MAAAATNGAAPVVEKIYVSYNDVHSAIQKVYTDKIQPWKPDLLIAIGTGGYLPARIVRAFAKKLENATLPIQCVGLSLYEDIGGGQFGIIGQNVVKTQWFKDVGGDSDSVNLLGKRVMIVDEIDDTRTTLGFAVGELEKNVAAQRVAFEKEHQGEPVPETVIGIFVVHNKLKKKAVALPSKIMDDSYFSGEDIEDKWIVYAWDAVDIEEHQALCDAQNARRKQGAVNGGA